MVPPESVRPFSSAVNVTKTGLSDTSLTPNNAARASGNVIIVSITKISTPDSSRTTACSLKISFNSSTELSPYGYIMHPVGAISPATNALPCAALTVNSTKRRLYPSISDIPCCISLTLFPPKVGVSSTIDPASTYPCWILKNTSGFSNTQVSLQAPSGIPASCRRVPVAPSRSMGNLNSIIYILSGALTPIIPKPIDKTALTQSANFSLANNISGFSPRILFAP